MVSSSSKKKMRNFFEEEIPCCEVSFWISLVMSLGLLLFAATTSGLALGLLSFSQVDLEVFTKAGQPIIQKHAGKIIPIVKNEHLVLCTLLLAKTFALEGVSIFMEKMFPEWLAIIFSCTLLGFIAEIIPQALCSRYGLSVGATLSPFVRALLLVLFPLAYPISKVLDWLLGKGHTALLGRAELKTLVNLHATEAGKGGELSRYETSIIAGALDLTVKTAKDAMTPISETFSLDINSKLDMYTMGLIMSKGHSRVPIYSGIPTDIIGLILVKNLIFCRPEDETPIKYLTVRRIPRVGEDWPLYDILTQFQKGQSHMAVVVKNKDTRTTSIVEEGVGPSSIVKRDYVSISTDWNSLETEYYSATLKNMMDHEGGSDPLHKKLKEIHEIDSPENSDSLQSNEQVIGIITLEDIMEELLQEDILDETDLYVDVHQNIRINLNHSRRASSSSRSRSFQRLSTSRHQWKISNSPSSRISFFSPSDILPISPPRRS
ncbi:DUF21 domain-containing protein At2g14520-like [Prosopis cineraria]|uniref:DUF21 domain-containing protein At2g14520-like n=1 Tax=Prosopis cineraria TaxID=364024 RepID=UPI00240FC649|nr:DUF21 domain-containing protein At2g14520-like [Prosopis cineraria]